MPPIGLAGMVGAFETHSFMASITVHCPRCNSDHVYRHGKTPAGHVRYRCPACPHVFQLTYTYEARKPSVKDKSRCLCNDETCRRLLNLLSPFQIGFITSDDWGSYAREVPSEMHLTGKIFTQHIERNNLTLRTRIKRLARKPSASLAPLSSTRKWLVSLSKGTISADWRHHHNFMVAETENISISAINKTTKLKYQIKAHHKILKSTYTHIKTK